MKEFFLAFVLPSKVFYLKLLFKIKKLHSRHWIFFSNQLPKG